MPCNEAKTAKSMTSACRLRGVTIVMLTMKADFMGRADDFTDHGFNQRNERIKYVHGARKL